MSFPEPSEKPVPSNEPTPAFYDPVESTFYGQCVERLLSTPALAPVLADGVLEIGAGTARPVVEALRRSGSAVTVRGFERDPAAFEAARDAVQAAGVANYTVVAGDFFTHAGPGARPDADTGRRARCAIGNPPYLPAVDAAMGAAHLWGGPDGCDVARNVLACDLDVVLLMTASICDPLGLLAAARDQGYAVVDWAVRPLPFGEYCDNPAVRSRIAELGRSGRAFHDPDSYLLAGVTWVRGADGDQADALARVLTAAGSPIAHRAGAGSPRAALLRSLDGSAHRSTRRPA